MTGLERILNLKKEEKPSLSLEDIPYLSVIIGSYIKERDEIVKDELLVMFDIKESQQPYFLKISKDSIDNELEKIELRTLK